MVRICSFYVAGMDWNIFFEPKQKQEFLNFQSILLLQSFAKFFLLSANTYWLVS